MSTTTELLQIGAEVRLLELNGKPSQSLYIVVSKADRNGRVKLAETTTITRSPTGEIISARFVPNVTVRRLLPPHANQQANVVQRTTGNSEAYCPECAKAFPVTTDSVSITCPDHGEFQLFWTGVKPMSTTHKPAARTKTKAKAKVKKPATPKVAKEPILVDLEAIAKIGALWCKSNVKFDHPNVDLKAYVLIVTHTTNGSPDYRKFCFNTYNGTMGKKATEPVDMDVFKDHNSGTAIPNLEKVTTKLTKDGYSPYK